jgi:polyisoprenoid-binding protein YceI
MPRATNIRILALLLAAGAAITLPAVAGLRQPQAKSDAAVRLEVDPGTKISYRVREQLAGISFPDDAVGTTDMVKGAIVILPDGSIDSSKSKLTIDLRELNSDQDMRDGYIKGRVLETEKFPNAEFVPRKLQGVPSPLPAPDRASAQSGFQLTGDLTIRGVTKEVTLNGYATFSRDLVAGRAMTDFTFATFGLPKPQLARLLSVDDKIQLDLEFKFKRQ